MLIESIMSVLTFNHSSCLRLEKTKTIDFSVSLIMSAELVEYFLQIKGKKTLKRLQLLTNKLRLMLDFQGLRVADE